MAESFSYKDSGVNIDAGTESVNRIKKLCESTFSPHVISGIGAFGAIFDLKEALKSYRHPVLVQSMDGVGTKLMVATMAGNHRSVGIDLVNHSANDILCQGALPLTFMDYIASSSISPDHVAEVLEGMSMACRDLGMSLIGGEIAELPAMYQKNQYDLAGCITGVAEKDEIVTGSEIKTGDVVIGLASSGLHTNGYSMLRKIFFDICKIPIDRYMEEMGRTLGEELLIPHLCYTKIIAPFIREKALKGVAHITGGGFFDNPPRILPLDKKIIIKKRTWPVLPVFKLIQMLGNVSEHEMYRTFNMGIGLMVVIAQEKCDHVLNSIKSKGMESFVIGEVADGKREVELI